MSRDNFTDRALRDEIFKWNARDLIRGVDGVEIQEANQADRLAGRVYYCENCKFAHTDRKYFQIDHLVPDKQFRGTGRKSNIWQNAIILCGSVGPKTYGCNQTKQDKNWPPPYAGLARTLPDVDMNWMPMHLRDANTVWP